ncbi:MAG: hypothetical protein QOF24_178, partial [Verrucomicrobiota bacterium]
MQTVSFRVKPYAHPKYKFVVRAKMGGKWKRSYFQNEEQAVSYAREQNALLLQRSEATRPDHSKRKAQKGTARNAQNPRDGTTRSSSSTTLPRHAVVILGMHRSGTSALGGALDIAGVNFGPRLAPAGKDNEKGYWEHPEIVNLHEELLGQLSSSWNNDAPMPSNWVKSGIAQDIQLLLRGVLERDFSGLVLFGLKDPRMCRLMPLWFPIFEKLQIRPHFILAVRHPWEVAQSLAKRDSLSPAKSYLLWLQHTLEAEIATRPFVRSFVSYDALLENPVAVLTRLRNDLGLRLPLPAHMRISLPKFLETALRHHRSRTRAKEANAIPSLAREVYEVLSANSTSAEISEKVSQLAKQFERGSSLFLPRINLLESEIANLDRQIPDEDAAGSESLVRLEVFRPGAKGYSETDLDARYFKGRSWKLLTIDLPATPGRVDRPLRIDPASYPAVIDLAEIAVKRAATGEVLWAASSENDFADFEVGGTACRLFHERYLRILSFGADPQLLLPAATVPLLKTPTRLELSILVDNRLETISSSVTAMQKQAEWKARTAADPSLVVYVDDGKGFVENHSLRAPLQMDIMQTIRFDDFEAFCMRDSVRLRIDPIDRPAAIGIASIRIIRNADDSVLYAAEDAQAFATIGLSEGLTNHRSGNNLVLLATNSDPQLYLAPITGITSTNLRLEITLEVQSASPELLRRYRHVLQERELLAPELEHGKAKLAELEAASRVWEQTFSALRNSLEGSQVQAGQLVSKAEENVLEISRLEKELEDRRAAFKQLSDENAARESEVHALQALVYQERAASAKLAADLESSQFQAGQLVSKAQEGALEISRLEKELEDRRAAFKQLSDENAARVAAFESEVHALQALVDQERAASAKLAVDLQSERLRAQERQAAIESAGEQIKTLHFEIADLHDLVAENRGQVRELSARLEAERTQNSGQVSELSAQLEAERTQNSGQVSELSAQLEAERTQNS